MGIKPIRWWAYLDDQGMIHVKRYINEKSIHNYEQLPIVKGIFDPFWAYTYEQAKAICLDKYQQVLFYDKRIN